MFRHSHFFADTLTLQLWKDRKEKEKKVSAPTKGSSALSGFCGAESAFSLDRENLTLALLLKEEEEAVIMAFDSREDMLRWQVSEIIGENNIEEIYSMYFVLQVRLTSQFEETVRFSCKLISSPSESKVKEMGLAENSPMSIHVQSGKFTLAALNPQPRIVHSWDLNSLRYENCICDESHLTFRRRYGALEGSRFVFEGGSRCGREGAGLHVLECDSGSSMAQAFDLSAKGRVGEAHGCRGGGGSSAARCTYNKLVEETGIFLSFNTPSVFKRLHSFRDVNLGHLEGVLGLGGVHGSRGGAVVAAKLRTS